MFVLICVLLALDLEERRALRDELAAERLAAREQSIKTADERISRLSDQAVLDMLDELRRPPPEAGS